MPNKTKGLNYEWLLRVTAAARAGKEVVVATSIPSCPFVGAVSPRADVAAFCVCGSRIRDVVPFNAALFAAKPISALLRGGLTMGISSSIGALGVFLLKGSGNAGATSAMGAAYSVSLG